MNQFFLFGIFWTLMSILYLLSQILVEEAGTFNYYMSFGYLIIGLLYFYQNYGKFYSFKLSSLMNITVTRGYLIIKAQNAQGTMASLKGFSEGDVAKLRARFDNKTYSL